MIIVNKKATDEIRNWLINKNITQNTLIIIGNTSCGKTYNINEIMKDYNCRYITPDICGDATGKELIDMLVKTTRYNLLDILNSDESKEKIIVIDELELFIGIDRTAMGMLTDFIVKTCKDRQMRFIVICNKAAEKRISELRKSLLSNVIYFEKPTNNEMFELLQSLYKNLNDKIINETVNTSDGYISQAIQNTDNINKTCVNLKNETDLIIPELEGLFINTPTRDEARDVFMQDPWMYPLRFHENLPHELLSRKGTVSAKESVYIKTLKMLIEWDILMSGSSDESSGHYSVPYAVEHISGVACNLLPVLKRSKISDINELQQFTRMLSRLSLQKKHSRQLNEIKNIPWKSASYLITEVLNESNKKTKTRKIKSK